jgi:hypothetical protein
MTHICSKLVGPLVVLGFALGVVLGLVACGASAPRVASGPRATLSVLFASAFRRDAEGDGDRSARAYLDVVREAARTPDDPWRVAAATASLDALVTRAMPALGEFADDAALAQRSNAPIAGPLEQAVREATGPLVRGMIARSLTRYYERRGDIARAEAWRSASGCAREAFVVGPLSTRSATGLDAPDPLDGFDAPVPPVFPKDAAFLPDAVPVAVRGHGCSIPLSVADAQPGIRDVVVDVEVAHDETIGVGLRSRGATVLRAGGLVAIRRPFDVVAGDRTDYALVTASPGVLRLVVRVGAEREDDSVEIDAWAEDGAPLRVHLPRIGSGATSRALATRVAEVPEPATLSERLLGATAAMALGRHGDAEQLARALATRPDAPPEMALLYGRAVELAGDLSPAVRAERGRAAYERVRDAWPGSWEATIAHAVLAGRRRSAEESGFETLRDLSAPRRDATPPSSALVDVFDALTSARRQMRDRARAALDRARPALGGTALFADAMAAMGAEIGSDHTATLCDATRRGSQDTLSCFEALKASGRHEAALEELDRLRKVDGAPSRFLPLELRERLSLGTPAGSEQARRVFDSMLAAERSLTAFAMLGGAGSRDRAALRAWARPRDASSALGPLLCAAGEDPSSEFDGIAEKFASSADDAREAAGVATTVLAHVERYNLAETGLLSWVLFDVRRVSGTTDVEQNANAAAPDIWGRNTMRTLRRRILKRDGRILEPDPTPHASQAHADLSELEPGDIVEAIDEGWATPTDVGGDLAIDTPDLLPERTAVRDASIELRVPRDFRAAHWSHALLGRPTERLEGQTQTLTWHVQGQRERRIEDGAPKMDRAVRVTFSTTRWIDVARTLTDTMTAMDDHNPEVASWVRQATGACATGESASGACGAHALPTDGRASINAIVHATGQLVHEADPMMLSDFALGTMTSASRTARSFLSAHEGSRSWLVLRGLRELGFACDLVVGENEPFSADAAFPPHRGRFSHPLVVAHVGGKDVWIDADVRGPPLPAGRLSPELRGRLALHMDGSIAPLPDVSDGSEQDEIDLRIELDEHRNARGTFAAILRGREAQAMAEALAQIVGAERQRALQNIVLAWLPWANVDDVELSSAEESWQVGLRAKVSIPGYAMALPMETGRPRGSAHRATDTTWILPGLDPLHWSSPRARVSTLGATFAARAGRRSALAVDTAVQYHVHRRVTIPHGAAVSRLPGPFKLKASLIDASRTIEVSGDAIEDDFVLGVRTGTVTALDYGAFVDEAHTADDAFLAGARIAAP